MGRLRGEVPVTKGIFGGVPTPVWRAALQAEAWLLRVPRMRQQRDWCFHCPAGVFGGVGRAGPPLRIREFCSCSLRKQHIQEESHQ